MSISGRVFSTKPPSGRVRFLRENFGWTFTTPQPLPPKNVSEVECPNLCENHPKIHTKWAPTSHKWNCNPINGFMTWVLLGLLDSRNQWSYGPLLIILFSGPALQKFDSKFVRASCRELRMVQRGDRIPPCQNVIGACKLTRSWKVPIASWQTPIQKFVFFL